MIRLPRLAQFTLGLTALVGCASAPPGGAVRPARMPDCSFRSASTCWTLAGRFPARRPVARDTTPERRLAEPPAALAAADDSVAPHHDRPESTESHQ
jgi:hypothetical protein